MGHIARPRFYRRVAEYVALMPISLVGHTTTKHGKQEKLPTRHLKVGDKFKSNELRLHVIKYLFLRGRVGPAGHPWTARALERRIARITQDEKPKEDVVIDKVEPVVEPVIAAKPKPAQNSRRRTVAKPKGQ